MLTKKEMIKGYDKQKNKQHIDFLIGCLKNSDVNVRLTTIEQLSEFEDQRLIIPLLMMLGDEERSYDSCGNENRVSSTAIESILKLSKDSDLLLNEIIIFIEDNQNHDIALSNALKILGRLKNPSVCDKIIPFLSHENPRVRGFAAYAVGMLGCKNAVRQLEVLLTDNQIVDEIRFTHPIDDPYANGTYWTIESYVSEYAKSSLRKIDEQKQQNLSG